MLSPPVLPPLAAPKGKWEREYQAFQRLLPQLLCTHRGKYVVLHEGQVVDSGDDDLVLALRFFAGHGNVPIHVGLVTDQPEPAIRIPHYRELARAAEGS
jgi:hypothetical protein